MKCPMLTMYATTFKIPEEYQDRDCLGDECAWWYQENEACSMLTLAQGVTYLHKASLVIAARMPKDLAPR